MLATAREKPEAGRRLDSEERPMKRRLAAILAADIVGYSRLMAADETGTLSRVNALLDELVRPSVTAHGGRIFKLMGDGVLAEFASVVDAVQCAVAIQRGAFERDTGFEDERRLRLRIGINLGDVIAGDGGDMHGDGINVAARLESLADPDGVFISRSVRDQIRDKLNFKLEDLGEQQVKNIPRPVRVFRLLDEERPVSVPKTNRRRSLALAAGILLLIGLAAGASWWRPWNGAASGDSQVLALPERPSIAVLPFDNLSDDPDQAYFADGISEDIIIGLSKVAGIFVIARNSSFAYKDERPDARQVSRDLGVRYVLSGSVRRLKDELLITASLVDAVKDNNVWAERYDRRIDDLFEVQADISKQVVRALAVALKASEQERLFRPHTGNLEAYDLFLRARKTHIVATPTSLAEARGMYERVIELDPGFAGGYAGLSTVYAVGARLGFSAEPQADGRRALQLAQKAIDVDPDFSWSYIALGGAWTVLGDPQAAVEAVRQAVELQPNDADAQLFLGWYLTFAGKPALGIEHIETAMRLDPVPNNRQFFFLGVSHLVNGQPAAAVKALERRRGFLQPIGLVFLAASYAAEGARAQAAQTVKELLARAPNFDLADWTFVGLFAREQDRQRILGAARAAGIPDSGAHKG